MRVAADTSFTSFHDDEGRAAALRWPCQQKIFPPLAGRYLSSRLRQIGRQSLRALADFDYFIEDIEPGAIRHAARQLAPGILASARLTAESLPGRASRT